MRSPGVVGTARSPEEVLGYLTDNWAYARAWAQGYLLSTVDSFLKGLVSKERLAEAYQQTIRVADQADAEYTYLDNLKAGLA